MSQFAQNFISLPAKAVRQYYKNRKTAGVVPVVVRSPPTRKMVYKRG
jgi:hypothetical protein